jgi:DNA-binding response OmpR family regulator
MTSNPIDKIPSILFVDDDKDLCRHIKKQIDPQIYQADFVHFADMARKKLSENKYDLVFLDIVMPGENGLSYAKELKNRFPETPFVFLTAQNEMQYKSEGFESGAEDFISKPFHITELLYRVKAILRRTGKLNQNKQSPIFHIGSFTFDSGSRKLSTIKVDYSLSIKESELLTLFCLNINQYISREEFLKKVWGKTDEFTIDSMDVYLNRLRKYLSSDLSIKIENLRGMGFRLLVK